MARKGGGLPPKISRQGDQLSRGVYNFAEELALVRNIWIGLACDAVRAAAELGGTFVNFHLGCGIDAAPRHKHTKLLEFVLQAAEAMTAAGEEHGIDIAIENMYPEQRSSDFCYMGDKLSDFEVLFERISSRRLGLCYDYGHGNLDEHGIDILRKYADRLIAVHAHDNDQLADIHWPLSRGTIKWEQEIAFLNHAAFTGPFILESFPENQAESLAFLRTKGLPV